MHCFPPAILLYVGLKEKLMNTLLYAMTIILLLLSALKDRHKTKRALRKALKSFENILPQLLVVVLSVSLLLSVMDQKTILSVIGKESRWWGVLLASVVGALTLIPGFVAFPTAALLLQGGAGYMQIAAFVSTLMMVGIITLPVEMQYFGKRLALLRNLFAYLFSLLVALVIGTVMEVLV
jgi:uncharacterized membrane protein YraQ (UPF0718 family)